MTAAAEVILKRINPIYRDDARAIVKRFEDNQQWIVALFLLDAEIRGKFQQAVKMLKPYGKGKLSFLVENRIYFSVLLDLSPGN